jgi:hypothetical protein
MKLFALIFTLSVIILSGCLNNKIVEEPKVLSGVGLQALIISAANGEKHANDSLSGLIDLDLADNTNYYSIRVDSFYIDSIKYFSAILEYPNPIYNRLAIYDTLANCYLIDKSLNGDLSFEALDFGELKFLKIVESFISKDTLSLVKLSFYRKINNSIKLVYRSFAELQTPVDRFYQTINFISVDSITTEITVPKKYKLNFKDDVFAYDSISNFYYSKSNTFDSLVFKEVANFKYEGQKLQIEAIP